MGATVEQVVGKMADELDVSRHWLELWDEEESVRMLNLFALPEYRPAVIRQSSTSLTDEAAVRAFVMAHPQFFYADKAQQHPRRDYAVVIWPHVEEIAKGWKKTRDRDYNGAAKAMTALLKKAGLKPPANG